MLINIDWNIGLSNISVYSNAFWCDLIPPDAFWSTLMLSDTFWSILCQKSKCLKIERFENPTILKQTPRMQTLLKRPCKKLRRIRNYGYISLEVETKKNPTNNKVATWVMSAFVHAIFFANSNMVYIGMVHQIENVFWEPGVL